MKTASGERFCYNDDHLDVNHNKYDIFYKNINILDSIKIDDDRSIDGLENYDNYDYFLVRKEEILDKLILHICNKLQIDDIEEEDHHFYTWPNCGCQKMIEFIMVLIKYYEKNPTENNILHKYYRDEYREAPWFSFLEAYFDRSKLLIIDEGFRSFLGDEENDTDYDVLLFFSKRGQLTPYMFCKTNVFTEGCKECCGLYPGRYVHFTGLGRFFELLEVDRKILPKKEFKKTIDFITDKLLESYKYYSEGNKNRDDGGNIEGFEVFNRDFEKYLNML